jgi:hypothetical protein
MKVWNTLMVLQHTGLLTGKSAVIFGLATSVATSSFIATEVFLQLKLQDHAPDQAYPFRCTFGLCRASLYDVSRIRCMHPSPRLLSNPIYLKSYV